ncbi:MAG: hypothetical protein NVS2B3_02070 [Vulcanimicrobiaceae bacterium]
MATAPNSYAVVVAFSKPVEAIATDDFRKRATPAIFLVDEAGIATHAFGATSPWIDASGRFVSAIAVAAKNLIDDRHEVGGTSAALAGDAMVRLLPATVSAPTMHCILVERFRTRDPLGVAIERYQISRREADVLRHVLAGEGTASIAGALGIAETTVGDHIKSIARKTDARGRGQIVARVLGYL